MIQRQNNLLKTIPLTVLGIFLLAACGGGGGKSPKTAPTPIPQTPQVQSPQPQTESQTPDTEAAGQLPQPSAPNPNKPVAPNVPAKPDDNPPQPPEQPDTGKVQPGQPKAEPPKADENAHDILNKLSLETRHGLVTDNTLKMVFNDQRKTVEIDLIRPEDRFIQNNIHTLRDSTGKVTGYYGFTAVNHPIRNDYGEFDGSKVIYHYLQSADAAEMRRPVTDGEISYRGNMYYHYHDTPTDFLTAEVSAKYYGGSKTMSMQIHDDNGGVWTLQQERNPRSSARVNVEESGHVGGHLFFRDNEGNRPVFNGNFTGGFYGANGSVLTGKANHEGKNAWEGVIGAVAQ